MSRVFQEFYLSRSSRKATLGRLLALAVFASLIQFVPTPSAEASGNSKRTICHRTKSATNPYRKITVSNSAVNNADKGHQKHDGSFEGDVWTTADVSGGLWGDIIPPNDKGQLSQNWTAAGQAIFRGQVFVPSTGKQACRSMTMKEFIDVQRAAGATDAEIVDDIKESESIEDAAAAKKAGVNNLNSLTTSNLNTVADKSESIAAITDAATSITNSSATFNGRFKADSSALFFYFEHTIDDPTFKNLPSKTTCTALNATNNTFSRSTSTSLASAKKYFYRAVLTDSCSSPTTEVFGEIYSFTTSSNSYRVIYNASGGSGGVPTDPNAYVVGETAFIYGNVGGLTKAGATFRNWSTVQPQTLLASNSLTTSSKVLPRNLKSSPDVKLVSRLNSGVSYLKAKVNVSSAFALKGGDELTINGNVTLYATYSTGFSVTYSGNSNTSGAAPTDTNQYANSQQVTVLDKGNLAKPGYTFGGWCTTQPAAGSACTGTSYNPNATFAIAADMNLYAIWNSNKYTYNANSNSVSGTAPAEQPYTGSALSASSTSMTLAGYSFAGWCTTQPAVGAACSGTRYVAQAALPIPESPNVILYAIWRQGSLLNLIFDSQGGSATPTISFIAGDTVNLPAAPTRAGYGFDGWFDSATVLNKVGDAGGSFPTTGLSADKTLYAKWTINTYLVTYDKNASDATNFALTPVSVNHNDSHTVLSPGSLARVGYTFGSWNLDSQGGGLSREVGETFTVTVAVTLYAQWSPNTYSITYDANGGTGSIQMESFVYPNPIEIESATALTRSGFTFSHWYTNSSGTSGTRYDPGNSYSSAADLQLYAIWTPNAPSGGGSTPAPVATPPTPTITWAKPANIPYPTPLSATQLNAVAICNNNSAIPGTYTYDPALGTVLAVGTHTLKITWTPLNANDCLSATTTVQITVTAPAAPTITWAKPAPVTGPLTLGPTQLNAVCSVPGTLTYSPALGTVLEPGTYKLKVTCVPTDPNVPSVSTEVEIEVTKQTPTITWPTPSPVAGPVTLTNTQLNAVCSVPGTLVYTPALGAVREPGTYTLSVTCNPTDSKLYGPVTGTVVLTVLAPKTLPQVVIPGVKTTEAPAIAELNSPTAKVTNLCDGIGSATLKDGKLTYTPNPTFSGKSCVNVVTTVNGASTALVVPVIVNPVGPVAVSSPTTFRSGVVSWEASPNAVSYKVAIRGTEVCATTMTSCDVAQTIGPKTPVTVTALGRDGTFTDVKPKYSIERPLVALVVNFDTAKFNLKPSERKKAMGAVRIIKREGFTRMVIGGHTDSRLGIDNDVLSRQRAESLQKFIKSKLPTGTEFKISYSAFRNPVASNKTKAGKAQNRRAELAVW